MSQFVDAEEEEVNNHGEHDNDSNDNDRELAKFPLDHIDMYDFEPGEFALVGVSLGGGFDNTAELK